MKLSIVIAFLDSHEAVRRQVLHFKRMNLPDDIEFIFVDDGSNPPHSISDYNLKNLTLAYTHDTRPWTQGLARNFGVGLAKGEYLFVTDIDHILSKEAIMAAYKFTGHKMMFPRFLAVLTEKGALTQDIDVLKKYGLDTKRLQTDRGLYASYHGNTWVMKKKDFVDLGMNNPKFCQYGHHAPSRGGEDGDFNARWNRWARERNIQATVGPKIYMFTNGRYNVNKDPNPMGLFHKLSYE
jgi:hypothetical protein